MSRDLDTSQAPLVASSGLAIVHLLKLVTYSDKDAGTVDETFYISRRISVYDYGNTGSDQLFYPWLDSIGRLRSSIVHMPSRSGGGIVVRTLEIQLRNCEYAGSRVATLLTAATLEGATIEVSELAIPDFNTFGWSVDLTAYDGDEHTVFYRGKVSRRVITSEKIILYCETEFYNYEWPTVIDDSIASPQDVGFRYPIPYGNSVEILCPAYQAGWITTLVDEIADDTETGSYEVIDASGFPASGSFEIRIGNETGITASYVDDLTINISARGGNAGAHNSGALIYEIVSETIYIASRYAASVNSVSIKNPLINQLIRVTSGFSVTPDDDSVTPTATTIKITDDSLSSLITLLGGLGTVNVFASVNGPTVPMNMLPVYDFDDTTGWSIANCTDSEDGSDKVEGSYSHYINVGESETTLIYSCESEHLPGITTYNCTVTRATYHTQGSYSYRIDPTGGGNPIAEISGEFDVDLSESGDDGRLLIAVDVRTQDTSEGTVKFRLGSGSGDYFLYSYKFSEGFVDGGFCTVILDWEAANNYVGGTGLDETSWRWIQIQWMNQSGQMWFDNIRTFRSTAQLQRNLGGGVDFTPIDVGAFPCWFKCSEPQTIDAVEIFHSDATGSGTTKETNSNSHRWDSDKFVGVEEWTQLIQSGDDTQGTGSGDVSDTDYFRVELRLKGKCITPDPLDVTLYMDDLEKSDTPTENWKGDAGSVIEHPADVARHWIREVAGLTDDDTTFDLAETNLGSNEICGDARGWGLTWIQVLDYIAFLSRANFVPEETSDETVWKMLTAESDYTFAATGGTLDQFGALDFLDAGRDQGLDLFSGRTFLYNYKPSIGNGDEAFIKLIRIGSDQNDASSKVSSGTIDAAVAAFGKIDAEVAMLLGISDETTAIEIAGYYYTEGARLASLFVIQNLSWSQGYDLEVGDIRDFERPWESGSIKARIIELTKDFRTQLVEVRCVEVT